MKTLNFVIIKLTLCLILGIVLSHYTGIILNQSFYAFVVTFLGFISSFFMSLKLFRKTIWFGVLTYITTICLGSLIYNIHDEQNFSIHYTQFIHKEDKSQSTLKFRITERLKPSRYHNKFIAELIKRDGQSVCGKLLVNVNKDSLQRILTVDDIIIAISPLSEIQKPLNPNQFDYSAYLEKQYIFHQVYTDHSAILKLDSETHTLLGYASGLRHKINKKLKQYNFNSEELAIINALILGQRQDMSQTTYNNYVDAGAIHILAVSGLHVGIILLLLNFCLKPIEYFKYGKLIKVILIVMLLWSFAFIAGLSASVTRAVTMFSIVTIAMNWRRPTNIYNTLTISIFILLLFKPMFLFDVGFQMSYLAVLAIVTIQPLLYRLWQPKWKVTDYFWQIFTVTIAAQFGVVPVSLFYFHQFPGLFFVSNLIIIPFLGLILGFGILVIVLALLNGLPEWLANSYGMIINTMNTIISWVSQQESFLFRHISFNIEHVVVCYLLIASSIVLYKKRNAQTLSFFLISILCVQCVWLYSKYRQANSEFIIFHKSRSSVLGQKNNSELKVYHNLDSIALAKHKTVTNYKVANFIDSTEEDSLVSVYQFQNKTLLIIDSLGVYQVKSFKPDYILLRNSPRINLKRLIDSIRPKVIVADGSNYKSYIKRWEVTCIKHKLPFHYTGKKGAFILKDKYYSDSLNSGLNAR